MVGLVGFRIGHMGVGAVGRRCRRQEHVLRRMGARGFQQLERAADIAFEIRSRLFDRVPHTRLCSQVNDDVGRLGPKQAHQHIRVLDPRVDCLEMLVLHQHLVTPFLQRHVVIIGHRIEPDDPKPVLKQACAKEIPDEPSGTGNQNCFHEFFDSQFLIRSTVR